MTTIDALKNLYVELGGNLKDVENINVIPKMIDALSEIAGSTIDLPAVTSDNNGEVLTVVDGNWTNGNFDGAKIYDVTNQSYQLRLPTGVVSSDIYAELEAGKNIKFKDQNGFIYSVYIGKVSGYHIYSQTYKDYSNSKILCVMFAVQNNSNSYFDLSVTELTKAQ